jgi:hypothetical protein
VLFDRLKATVKELGGEPGNEIGRLNKVDPLKATSLRVRGMWLLDHPAKVFNDFFVKPQEQVFVLNALVSASKWDEYSTELIDEVNALSHKGLKVERIDLPDSGGSSTPLKAVHISWEVSVA